VGAVAKVKGAAPPPPKPKPSILSGELATETAQHFITKNESDLRFVADDMIDIVIRTYLENDWWRGKIEVKEG